MPRILVVDDEKNILELVRFNLEREGYEVLTCLDGARALELARSEKPDLIVLDVMLPEISGLEVCRELHQDPATRKIPIIMLSARADELDRVLGLEMGADDYVTKPFSPRELVARVKARLRRSPKGGSGAEEALASRLDYGRMVIDEDRFAVYIDGEKQDFTPKEFELIRFLARHPGKVFSREQLLEQVWGYDYAGDSRTVDVHIRHIRHKLEILPGGEQVIETVRGVGYRFREGWRC
ncbi:MAG TPA: response regulator transcription factor [Bacillota bacterium]|jgi:two-component system alkaline phosphatase synthesis response regulator PhoP|nr:response regulator transcription factor [Peptococcaceae bacterium MAG4]NLW38751.1 response regulator transcription factor [Peptococcaceae bacterium]HPZ43843.1 response regulator transcription factor [Bacillota bacterium]HQD76584.1 response regulator transcription factor [Bacillota bacterium]HUM59292.1 response regulator transcription factor [Bacillota bacterium]